MRNGGHTGAAPSGVKIQHDHLAFHLLGFDLAIEPTRYVQGRHGFTLKRGVRGANLRVIVPCQIIRELSSVSAQPNSEDGGSNPTIELKHEIRLLVPCCRNK